MWNKLYIIIDKKSTKPLFLWRFSFVDIVMMCIAFLIGFIPLRILVNEYVGMVLGIGLFAIMGFLLIEMPDHLSILQHIKMWYEYEYKNPKEYFYMPETEIMTNEIQEDEETMEWVEFEQMAKRNQFSK